EDGIRDRNVTGVHTCALPICYEGKCRNLHGHRWKLEVTVSSEELAQEGQIRGMIVDFGELKKDVKDLADEFDHCLIIDRGTLKEIGRASCRERGSISEVQGGW